LHAPFKTIRILERYYIDALDIVRDMQGGTCATTSLNNLSLRAAAPTLSIAM
jgi:hypothetical protein